MSMTHIGHSLFTSERTFQKGRRGGGRSLSSGTEGVTVILLFPSLPSNIAEKSMNRPGLEGLFSGQSTCCSYRVPGFTFQHPPGDLQLPVSPVPSALEYTLWVSVSTRLVCSMHTYVQARHLKA